MHNSHADLEISSRATDNQRPSLAPSPHPRHVVSDTLCKTEKHSLTSIQTRRNDDRRNVHLRPVLLSSSA